MSKEFRPLADMETDDLGRHDPVCLVCPDCGYSVELSNIARTTPEEQSVGHARDCTTCLELGVRTQTTGVDETS